MARGLVRTIAALGMLGAGYAKGMREAEEAKAREEERQRRREEWEREDAIRRAAAETLGKVGTEIVRPEDTAGVLGPQMQELMRRDMETFGPDAGKLTLDSALYSATPQQQAAASGIKPVVYTRDQAATDFAQRLYQIDPMRAAQAEATQLQLGKLLDERERTKKLKEVDASAANWVKQYAPKDDKGNPIMDDETMVKLNKLRTFELANRGLFDNALQAAREGMQYAANKIALEESQRKAAVRDAVAAAGMGDFSRALEVYNKFVPDGSRATKIVQNKDGSLTVERVSDVDGTPLPSGTFKNLDHLVSAISSLGDSKALINYVERTFKHDIESRRLDIMRGQLAVAQAAESRAKAKDERQQKREEEAAQALADMDAAERAGDVQAYNSARRRAIAAGVKLDKPTNEYTANVDNLGMTVTRLNKATGQMEIIDPKTGNVIATVPAPGSQSKAGSAPKVGEERTVQAGPHKGKTAVWDGKGWVLKQ